MKKQHRGIIVSTGGFADNAVEYADEREDVTIELYDASQAR